MKKYLFILLVIPNIVFGDVIFKCVDGENVSYLTFKNNKPDISSCVPTDLGNNYSTPVIKSDKKIVDTNIQSAIAKPVSLETQIKRDDTRSKILNQELESEKKLLLDLITKATQTKDEIELKKINNLIGNHNSNIKSLQKALGLK